MGWHAKAEWMARMVMHLIQVIAWECDCMVFSGISETMQEIVRIEK